MKEVKSKNTNEYSPIWLDILDQERDQSVSLRHKYDCLGINRLLGLVDLIEFLPGGIMVEEGCHIGESTEMFSKKFDKIYAIDPWCSSCGGCELAQKLFDERVKNLSNIIKMCMVGSDAVDNFENETLDFVYIDSQHTYDHVKNAAKYWYPKLRDGSYFGGHDYYLPQSPGVIDAVNELSNGDFFLFSDTSWVIAKSNITL